MVLDLTGYKTWKLPSVNSHNYANSCTRGHLIVWSSAPLTQYNSGNVTLLVCEPGYSTLDVISGKDLYPSCWSKRKYNRIWSLNPFQCSDRAASPFATTRPGQSITDSRCLFFTSYIESSTVRTPRPLEGSVQRGAGLFPVFELLQRSVDGFDESPAIRVLQ